MTQKEVNDFSKMIPRFKEVCCSRMCGCWETCKESDEDKTFLNCGWFFNYRLFGWPKIKLSYFSYNLPKMPDLRVEDIDTEKLNEYLKI